MRRVRGSRLWLLDGDDRLGPVARREVHDAGRLVVSVASLWELAIRASIGKLAPIPSLYGAVGDLGFERLGIADGHLRLLETLPHLHRDPFDRLLISQAAAETLTVLTTDRAFEKYAVDVLDARL